MTDRIWHIGDFTSLFQHIANSKNAKELELLKTIAELKEELAIVASAPKGDKETIEGYESAAEAAKLEYENALESAQESANVEFKSVHLGELLNELATVVGFE